MLCSLPVAWFLLLPKDFIDFGQSIAAVSIFSSNVLFWAESGYFEAASELKPLLHTWSLGVEEQYYLVFPLFLMVVWRYARKHLLGVLILLAILSLAIAQWGVFYKPEAAFFLLPMRGWELAIGAIVAVFCSDNKPQFISITSNKTANDFLGLAGLILILFSIFYFDQTTPFPGFNAFIPTIGTALIILFARSETLVGKMLSIKPIVGVGLISYSVYLWHQPIFVFARHGSIVDLSLNTSFALIIISLVSGYLSWKFVENPFRHKGVITKRQIYCFSLLGSVFFILIGLTIVAGNGFKHRFNIPNTISDSFARSDKFAACFDKKGVHEIDDWFCLIGKKDSEKPSFFVFGDSHAYMLVDVFDKVANELGVSGGYAGVSGCIPFLGVHSLRKDQNIKNCHELNKRVYKFIAENKIKTIFLAARWSYYTDGSYSGNDFSYIGLEKYSRKNKKQSRLAFEHGLEETFVSYQKLGVKIVVLEQVPQQMLLPEKAYSFIYNNNDYSDEYMREMSVSIVKHRALQRFSMDVFSKYADISKLGFEDILCDDDKCLLGNQQYSFYFDDDHLSLIGASLLENKFRDALSGASN